MSVVLCRGVVAQGEQLALAQVGATLLCHRGKAAQALLPRRDLCPSSVGGELLQAALEKGTGAAPTPR